MAAILGTGPSLPARLLVEAVPPSLVSATLKAAFGFGSAQTIQAGAIAASLALAQGVLTTMKIAQLKWLGLAILATCLLAGGVVAVSFDASARRDAATANLKRDKADLSEAFAQRDATAAMKRAEAAAADMERAKADSNVARSLLEEAKKQQVALKTEYEQERAKHLATQQKLHEEVRAFARQERRSRSKPLRLLPGPHSHVPRLTRLSINTAKLDDVAGQSVVVEWDGKKRLFKWATGYAFYDKERQMMFVSDIPKSSLSYWAKSPTDPPPPPPPQPSQPPVTPSVPMGDRSRGKAGGIP